MTSNEIMTILEEILQTKRNSDNECIEENIQSNPFGGNKYTIKYEVKESSIIATNSKENKSYSGTLNQFLWNRLRLGDVCEVYKQEYEHWMELNNGIPYVETRIVNDSDESNQSSRKFMQSICDKDSNETNRSELMLLMAEYGMGKSSFCQGLRKLVVEEIEALFIEEKVLFPFVFDLNEYRNGAFDEFIQNQMVTHYGIDITFSMFKILCQAGIFCVVLDAWDQMHNTPVMSQTRKDITQFSALWKNNGRVLITCRRSFYQKQLHMKKNDLFNFIDKQTVKFYTLSGFGVESARDYFDKANKKLIEDCQQPIDLEWIDDCWKINIELFSRPLNLKLLVKHIDAITEKCELSNEKVETYQFLYVILSKWYAENNIQQISTRIDILKSLVLLTLEEGLNRSASLESLKQMVGSEINSDDDWKKIIDVIGKLDFVSINNDNIDFRLAAYQEFLWAYYVLKELKEGKLCDRDKLLNRFMLTQEVRTWLVRELKQNENDCLKRQLDLIKYKAKAEIGYSGSNAITLLRDLKDVEYYKNQLSELIKDLRLRIFDEADLRGLDLTNANFEGSSLIGADLSYTKLENSIMSNTNLYDVTMNEYGKLKKCAFLNDTVVVGTESGSLLTFSITNKTEEIRNLADETIMDVATDRAGVYTASQDGWISYIKDGKLKNAYIVSSGLQSIDTSGTAGSIYVGANDDGIYRYNWNSGAYHKIHVNDNGKSDDRYDVNDIHFYRNSIDGKNYVAYISSKNKSLVLLSLEGTENANVEGKTTLLKGDLKFGDICFADSYLIYSIVGKGVYYISIGEMDGSIEQNDLLHDRRCLYKCTNPVELAWVKKNYTLMILEKVKKNLDSIICIQFTENKIIKELEIEWIYDGKYRAVKGDTIEGFCVSDDANYIALSGDKLLVLELVDNDYYQLVREPIEAKISCKNADFTSCIGLSENIKDLLKERGAILERA